MSAVIISLPRRPARPFLTSEERAGIEAAIEDLLAILDRADGDADLEETMPEKHGRAFVRCGPDECEDRHDAEAVNEDGDELDRGEFDEAEAIDRWHERNDALA